jgi:hypothetical protein
MRPPLELKEKGKDYRLDYLVSLPEGHATGGPWPVLCFLHGRGEAAGYCVGTDRTYPKNNPAASISEGIKEALRAHGPLKDGSALPQDNFIVVVPQLPDKEEDWGPYEEKTRNGILSTLRNF